MKISLVTATLCLLSASALYSADTEKKTHASLNKKADTSKSSYWKTFTQNALGDYKQNNMTIAVHDETLLSMIQAQLQQVADLWYEQFLGENAATPDLSWNTFAHHLVNRYLADIKEPKKENKKERLAQKIEALHTIVKNLGLPKAKMQTMKSKQAAGG